MVGLSQNCILAIKQPYDKDELRQKKKFEFRLFLWSAAITACFTAEAKEVPAPQFFQLFLTEYQKNYKNLQHN